MFLSLLPSIYILSVVGTQVPEQFHLALHGNASLSVSFKSNETSTPLTCMYGLGSNMSLTSSPSTVKSYFPGRGFYHHVLLSSLDFSEQYSYSCGGGPVFYFTSPPNPNAFSPFSLAVLGDWGYLGSKERGPSIHTGGLAQNWSAVPVRTLLEGLKNNGLIDMILHTGDISYADDGFGVDGDLLRFTYEDVYDAWGNWIQNLSAHLPYHVSVGNHEVSLNFSFECRARNEQTQTKNSCPPTIHTQLIRVSVTRPLAF